MDDSPITQRDLTNAVQGATLAAEVSQLRADVGRLDGKFTAHEADHQRAQLRADDRAAAARRFRITTSIAAVVALCAVLGFLADIAYHVH